MKIWQEVKTNELYTSSDTERMVALGNIRNQLEHQLSQLLMNSTADISKTGLYQLAEGMVWEGVCGLVYVLPTP